MELHSMEAALVRFVDRGGLMKGPRRRRSGPFSKGGAAMEYYPP